MSSGDWDALELLRRHPAERFVVTELTADPAAGGELAHTVPGGEAWLLLGALFSVVTDATVANRHARLEVTDGNRVVARVPAAAVQAASLTRHYTFEAGLSAAYAVGDDIAQPLPVPPILLLPGYTVRTVTAGIVAGDNYGAGTLYLERTVYRGLAAQIGYELALTIRELEAQDSAAARLSR